MRRPSGVAGAQKGLHSRTTRQRRYPPRRIFACAEGLMVATMVQRLHSFAVWVCPPSASFWKLSGQAKENCVPPRTESREVIFTGEQIRCLLVHNHVLIQQGLRPLLQDDTVNDVGSGA